LTRNNRKQTSKQHFLRTAAGHKPSHIRFYRLIVYICVWAYTWQQLSLVMFS